MKTLITATAVLLLFTSIAAAQQRPNSKSEDWPCYVHPATGVCEPAAFIVLPFKDHSKRGVTTIRSTIIFR